MHSSFGAAIAPSDPPHDSQSTTNNEGYDSLDVVGIFGILFFIARIVFKLWRIVGVSVVNVGRRARRERESDPERLLSYDAAHISYGSISPEDLRTLVGNGTGLADLGGQLTITGPQCYSGGFANIHEATWRREGKDIKVAVKVLRVLRNDQKEIGFAAKRICREVAIWSKFKHNNIIPLYGVAFGLEDVPNGMCGMVCKWADNGDLGNYFYNNNDVPQSVRFKLLRQISDGLRYLHRNSVVHGDLTGANILMDNEGNILLCDFGLSLILGDENNTLYKTSLHQKCNIPWSAPEIVIPGDEVSLPRPTKFTDIYSFGSVMLQILTGSRPYGDRIWSVIVIFLEHHKGDDAHPPRPARPSFISDELWEFMKQCWKVVPRERLCIEEVYRFLDEFKCST